MSETACKNCGVASAKGACSCSNTTKTVKKDETSTVAVETKEAAKTAVSGANARSVPEFKEAAARGERVTGWHSTKAAPNQWFEDGIESRGGRLFFHGIDLAQLADGVVTSGPAIPGRHCSLELIYLPAIRERVTGLISTFARASAKLSYTGNFVYCYASKANAAEEVMRAARQAGAHQETSACYDLHVMVHQQAQLLPDDRLLVCNGFKMPGSEYSRLLCELMQKHPNTIPIIDDIAELDAYETLTAAHKFQVGIRLKCWGQFASAADMDNCDCRFGFSLEQAEEVAARIAKSKNLVLKVIHAMVGSPVPVSDVTKWVAPLQAYAQFKKKYPTVDTFNFGGGLPAAFTPAEPVDYDAYVEKLLQIVIGECAKNGVPHPHLMGEFGRYTVSNHGAHLFKVLTVRENRSPVPYYIINGSIMSSFPDTWALKEHFTVLPLNHLDRPFQQGKLGGVTCDSDDMYPPHYTDTKLFLPKVETKENLWVGVFNCGAYQEMLGGVGGAKHCGIPESDELCIDVDASGNHIFEIFPGQSMDDVCKKLGYQFAHKHPERHGHNPAAK